MRIPASALLLCCTLSGNAQIDLITVFDGILPGPMVVLGDHLYFRATTPAFGAELWRSDGTPAGTVLVKDINPGAASGMWGDDLVVAGGTLYFFANDGVHGAELWKSDGTEAGTQLVVDLRPGAVDANVARLIALGDRVAFRGNNNAPNMDRLFRSDGTAQGTVPVLTGDGRSIGFIGFPVVFGDRLLLHAAYDDPPSQNTGLEPWITDLSDTLTYLLKDIYPGGPGSQSAKPFVHLDKAYFRAEDGIHGSELWLTDGTPAGTQMVGDLEPGNLGSDPQNFGSLGNTLIFSTLGLGWKRWALSNGGDPAVIMDLVAPNYGDDAIFSKSTSARVGDAQLFAAMTENEGIELWRTDGTTAGTYLVKDTWPGPPSGINNTIWTPDFRVFNGVLFFPAFAPNVGQELWRSDGTEAGTFMVQDRALGANHFTPDQLTAMGDHIYLTGTVPGQGRGLFRMAISTGMPELEAIPSGLRVAPNPSNGPITFQLLGAQATGTVQWRVHDLTGRLVHEGSEQWGGEGLVLDLSGIGSGAFVLSVVQQDRAIATTRVVMMQ